MEVVNALPDSATIMEFALNVLLELSGVLLPRSVSMFVDKTQLIQLKLELANALMDLA